MANCKALTAGIGAWKG